MSYGFWVPKSVRGYVGSVTKMGAEEKREQDYKALIASRDKWRGVVEGKDEHGTADCPLCQLYNNPSLGRCCIGCPIAETSGQVGCTGTPYLNWSDHHREEHYNEKPYKVKCSICREIALKFEAYLSNLANEYLPGVKGELVKSEPTLKEQLQEQDAETWWIHRCHAPDELRCSKRVTLQSIDYCQGQSDPQMCKYEVSAKWQENKESRSVGSGEPPKSELAETNLAKTHVEEQNDDVSWDFIEEHLDQHGGEFEDCPDCKRIMKWLFAEKDLGYAIEKFITLS